VWLAVRDDRFARQRLRVEAKEGGGEAALVLSPPRIVEGTVTYADTGKPAAGAGFLHGNRCIACHRSPFVAGESDAAADLRGRWAAHCGASLARSVALAPDPAEDLTETDVKGRYHLEWPTGGAVPEHLVDVRLRPAAGQPYLAVGRSLRWPKGAVRQQVDLKFHRGVLVRGRVVERPGGRPVAGARVDYWAKDLKLPADALHPDPVHTGEDGRFELVVPAGKGFLLANGPGGPYAPQKVAVKDVWGAGTLIVTREGADGDRVPDGTPPGHLFPDAAVSLDAPVGAGPREVVITLRLKEGGKGKAPPPAGK
jgi:hypothetical protein